MAKHARPRTKLIQFRCFLHDPWPVVVAGNLPELGNWDPNKGLELQLRAESGGVREWAGTFTCPLGRSFESKFVAKVDGRFVWESGENRVFSSDHASSEIAQDFRK